ncbi:MAG: cysteine desulfurase [Deltaproteobacteria bacterium]|nr:cysteine desulfurase [Deltaproteobacteria bacterium]
MTVQDGTRTIYLDHNATTPLLPEVREAMLPWLGERFGNPSSGHGFGTEARRAVERAREQVAELLGASPDEIVFTGSGTEANNLALRGLAEGRSERGGRIILSALEHPSVAACGAWLVQRGPLVGKPAIPARCSGGQMCLVLQGAWELVVLPADGDGRVAPAALRAALDRKAFVLSVMHAQNEVGTLEPVRELADLAHENGLLVHTDAAQSAGKLPTRVGELGVDMLTIAGHKLYAPQGVGALYVRRGVELAPVLVGAGHERGLRPGTENVAGLVGLGTACDVARRTMLDEGTRQRLLRDLLFDLLRQDIPGIRRNGHPTERLPNTLNVSFPGVRGASVLEGAPEVAATTGSACHAGDEAPSAVLTAMGVPAEVARGAVRLSLGRGTTEPDVERAAEALLRSWRAAREAT